MDAIKSMILTLFLHIANLIVVLISAGTCFLSMLTNVICVSHTPHTQILILSSSLIGAGIIIYHSVVVFKAFCTCYFCSILFLWPLHYIRIELLPIVYVYCCHLGFSEGRKLGQRCTCWWLTSIFLFFFQFFFFFFFSHFSPYFMHNKCYVCAEWGSNCPIPSILFSIHRVTSAWSTIWIVQILPVLFSPNLLLHQ